MKNITVFRKLAKGLRKVPPERFDMGTWSTSNTRMAAFKKCNTAGCAIGWIKAICPDAELKLQCIKRGLGMKEIIPVYKDSDGVRHHDYDAISEYFEIEGDEAMSLFSPSSYGDDPNFDWSKDGYGITPQMVANRMEEFLEEKGL